jgi:hypothetical protein
MRAHVKQGNIACCFSRARTEIVDEPRSSPLKALRGWWAGNHLAEIHSPIYQTMKTIFLKV